MIICKKPSLNFSGKCKFEEKIKSAAAAGAKGVIEEGGSDDHLYGCNVKDFEEKNSTEGWGGKIAIVYRGKLPRYLSQILSYL